MRFRAPRFCIVDRITLDGEVVRWVMVMVTVTETVTVMATTAAMVMATALHPPQARRLEVMRWLLVRPLLRSISVLANAASVCPLRPSMGGSPQGRERPVRRTVPRLHLTSHVRFRSKVRAEAQQRTAHLRYPRTDSGSLAHQLARVLLRGAEVAQVSGRARCSVSSVKGGLPRWPRRPSRTEEVYQPLEHLLYEVARPL